MMQQNEFESMTDPETRISELLRSLPRVDAPGDFEGKVRASIARGRPAPDAARYPWRRFAVPVVAAAALVAAGAIGIIRYTDTGEISDGVQAVSSVESGGPTTASSPAQNFTEEQTVQPVSEPPPVSMASTKTPSRGTTTPAKRSSTGVPRGGSIDQVVHGERKVLVVPGVNPTVTNQDPQEKDFQRNGPLDVTETLKFLGIDGEKTDAGWRVKTTSRDSVAERSGIKNGDVIESVDDTPLATGAASGDLRFRSLGVIRGGTRIRIQLRNE